MAAQKKGSSSPKTSSGTRGKAAGSSSSVRTSASGRSAGSGRKRSGGSGAGKPAERDELRDIYEAGIGRDIALLVILALSVLIFISLFGAGGPAGKVVSRAVFGIFGMPGYIFPAILFFGTAFYMANVRSYSLLGRKMAGAVILYIFLCVLSQLLTAGYEKGVKLLSFFTTAADKHTGGGFIGGLLVTLFGSLFGTAGAYIITLLFLFIGLILLTQKPLLTTLHHKSRDSVLRAKEVHANKRRLREETAGEGGTDVREEKRGTFRPPVFRKNTKDTPDTKDTPEVTVNAASAHAPVSDMIITENADRQASDVKPSVPSETYDPNELSAGLRESLRKNGRMTASPVFVGDEELIIPGSEDGDKVVPAAAFDADSDSDASLTAPISSDTVSDSAAPARRRRSAKAEAESAEAARAIGLQIAEETAEEKPYELPSVELLTKGRDNTGDSRAHLEETARKLQQVFADFGVNVKVVDVSQGPTVTRYELQPEHGVKVSRILSLSDDIKLNLAAADIRIEAPIPGKAAVGIEIPNKENSAVMLRDLLESDEFRHFKKPLAFAVGKDIAGHAVVADIAKMPHLLIAGATGSGKSVCINTLIMSILFKASPAEVRMLMIDPKVVELKIYDGIPHLLMPVVTDVKKASGTLKWAVEEMLTRYNKFSSFTGVRDIDSYNDRVEQINNNPDVTEKLEKMYRIVIIVDELADLMMAAPGEVEDAIVRLTQLARAAGIHVIIATQRPSVNVITGLIKANMPSRIALAVTSGVDSRTILDMNGAERLLGKGDMLFHPQNYPTPIRVQGAYVSDEDIGKIVKFLSSDETKRVYNTDIEQAIEASLMNSGTRDAGGDDRDEYFWRAGEFIIEKDKASIGMLQRMFKIGFNRAARIMDQLAEAGVVGPEEGTKPRQILMSQEQFENMREQGG